MIWIDIDRTSAKPLIRQVFEQIRALILSGKLKAGDRLPSTRSLASELAISRIVVMEAYEQLIAEGYVDSRQGSGTTVAAGIDTLLAHVPPTPPSNRAPSGSSRTDGLIDFRFGIPAVDMFPKKEWGRILEQTCLEMPQALFGYDRPKGRAELRQAVSEYLLRARGIECDPGRICITSGTTQSLAILARILYAPGAEAILEDPSSMHALRLVSSENYTIVPVPVDSNGIRTDLITVNDKTRFILVTPSHQFPLGEVLPIQRRLELVRLVSDTGCYILEDDYDSEFRFAGQPISSMYGCAPHRVIYLGTFSKAFSPALRLGYAILPDDLGGRFLDCKINMDVHNSVLEQLAMARFMCEGGYEKHIARMKKIYYQRQLAVLNALEEYFPGRYVVRGQSTGLNLIAEFPGVDFTEQVQKDAAAAGIRLHPVEMHAIVKGGHCSKIIIGYGQLTPGEIREGLRRLRSVLTGNRAAAAG